MSLPITHEPPEVVLALTVLVSRLAVNSGSALMGTSVWFAPIHWTHDEHHRGVHLAVATASIRDEPDLVMLIEGELTGRRSSQRLGDGSPS